MTLLRHRSQGNRVAVLGGGTIFFAGRTVPCLVRALSETGASLQVYAPDKLPDRFRVFLELDRREVDCRVEWREGKVVGVSFLDLGAELAARARSGDVRFDGAWPNPAGDRHPSCRRTGPILVAEDDPDDRQLLASAFDEVGEGPEISFVSDGAEAIRYLDGIAAICGYRRPSLIVLDLNMPKVDGLTVLRHMKSTSSLSSIPVVVLTTSSSEADIVSTYALGASSFIVKPSRYSELVGAVHAMARYWGGAATANQRAH